MSIRHLTDEKLGGESIYVQNITMPEDGKILIGNREIGSSVGSWQPSVISFLSSPPVGPNVGDRYIISAVATGIWTGKEDDITEFTSTGWIFITPEDGYVTVNEADNLVYIYDTSWTPLGIVTSHNALLGLQGGQSNEYYHLNSDEYSLRNIDKSTALSNGGVLSGVNLGNSPLYNISDGVGSVFNPDTEVLTHVSWSGLSNLTPTNIATQAATYIGIDSAGSVIESANDFTLEEQRDYIKLGVLIHDGNVNINFIDNQQTFVSNPINQVYEVMQGIGFLNIEGNIFSPNGVNLNINKSMGKILKGGSNYENDKKAPHTKTLSSLVAANFGSELQDGTQVYFGNAINPNDYDLNAVLTTVPNNKWTTQRIYIFVAGNVAVLPGQHVYASKAEALQNLNNETFNVSTGIAENGLLRGFLIVKEGTTDLSNLAEAEFYSANKFGNSSGIGTSSVSTMQQTYDNSITPEIVTNDTNGAVTYKRGSALDTDSVLEVLNGSDDVTMLVRGDGVTRVGKGVEGPPLPSSLVFAANYNGSQDANYALGIATGTFAGNDNTGSVSGGYLVLTNDDASCVTYEGLATLVNTVQTGCVRVGYKPNYSGNPSGTKYLIAISEAAGSANNSGLILHMTNGEIRVIFASSTGAVTTNILGTWVPVAGTDYDFELNYDLTAGASRLFIDGVQFGATITNVITRSSNMDRIVIGSSRTATAIIANQSYNYFNIYDSVQHTANFTPDSGEFTTSIPGLSFYCTDNCENTGFLASEVATPFVESSEHSLHTYVNSSGNDAVLISGWTQNSLEIYDNRKLRTAFIDENAKGEGIKYNVASGNSHTFQVNNVDVLSIDSNGIAFTSIDTPVLNVNTINELTTGVGVTIEGINIDNNTLTGINAIESSAPGVPVDVNGDINLLDLDPEYKINGTVVLNSDTLGSNIINSSLTNVGVLTGLEVEGTADVKNLQVESNGAISSQGTYVQFNRNSLGKSYLINQRGAGLGGISIGESDASNVYTEYGNFDTSGNFNISSGDLEVGSLKLDGNTLSSTSGNIILDPVGNNDVEINSQMIVTDSDRPPLNVVRTSTSTDAFGTSLYLKHKTSGDMGNDFASGLTFVVEDSSNIENSIASIYARRIGNDTSGRIIMEVESSGVSRECVKILSDGSTNSLFLENTSNRLRLDSSNSDSTISSTTGDININSAGNIVLDPAGNNDVEVNSQMIVTDADFPPLLTTRTTTDSNTVAGCLQVKHKSSVDMDDGFGSSIVFNIEDNTVEENIGDISCIRNGADNSGVLQFNVYDTGVNTTVLELDPNAIIAKKTIYFDPDTSDIIFGSSTGGGSQPRLDYDTVGNSLTLNVDSGDKINFRVNNVTVTDFEVNKVEFEQSNIYMYNLPAASSGVNLNITAGGAIYEVSSSLRFKHKINTIDSNNKMVKNFMKLNPVQFEYKTCEGLKYGFIAEELKEIDDVPVVYELDMETCKGIDYLEIVPVIVRKVQDQQKQIDLLTKGNKSTSSTARLLKRVVTLERENNELTKRLNTLEAQVNSLMTRL